MGGSHSKFTRRTTTVAVAAVATDTMDDRDVLPEPLKRNETLELISQGAEARVYKAVWLNKDTVVKYRFAKKYRHPDLDTKLTRQRTSNEAKALARARKLDVLAPTLYYVDLEGKCLYLERVRGISVKERIFQGRTEEDDLKEVLRNIGRAVATLHDGGVIHGDLTTSNMIITEDSKLSLIDFGLSFNSMLAEDKAVDLYVLERAFTSAHSVAGDLFSLVLEEYKKSSKFWCSTLNRFAQVRLRGRKRLMVG